MLLSPAAQAKDCGWNSDRSSYNCDDVASKGAIGGSAPLIGNTLESNPAALPVDPTPFGIELTLSNRSSPKKKPNFSVSTIKGFEGIGFGIGSWSEGTFGAPDFDNHFLGSSHYREFQTYQEDPPSVLGLRIGTTIVLPRGPLPKGIRFSLGGSLGLGRVSGRTSPQAGVLMKFYFLGLGYAQSFDQLSPSLPKTKIHTYAAAIPIGKFFLGYTYQVLKSSVNETYANTYSLRFSPKNWNFYGALKKQKDHRGHPDNWIRAGLQHRFGKKGTFGLGYEYGQYRYSHSMILQWYL